MPQPESTFYPRVFASVTAVLLGFAVLRILQPFIAPLLWAGLLAFLVFPLNLRLRARLKGRGGAAALLLTLAALVLVVVPVAVLVGVFVAQTGDLINRLQAGAAQYQIQRPSDVLELPAIEKVLQQVGEWLPVSPQQAQEALVSGGRQVLQALIGLTGSLFAGVFGAVAAVIIALFLLFFFLRDGELMVSRLLLLVPLEDGRKAHLVDHLSNVTRAVVLGSLVTALVQGTLVGIGFAIVRLPSPIVFAVLAMVASLLPIVGTTIIWVPAVVWLAIGAHWGSMVFLLIWSVGVVSSADNVVRPFFISSRARISTLPVFVGLLGGIHAFGAIGIFLGPVIIALVLALMRFAEEARAEARTSSSVAS